jgi:AAA family ATP:ADP antiporter
VALKRLLPGMFWFWLINVLLFAALFVCLPHNRWVASGFYVWFSVANLFMICVFWSLMVDLFSAGQATRLFALIAAGGEIGAIAGPLFTHFAVSRLGLPGLLLVAAAGLLVVIALIHLLIRAKQRLRESSDQAQRSTLDHGLSGNPLDGFSELFKSAYARRQALFILLMTWVNTVAYFFQTDLIARSFQALEARAQAIADIDLVVNVCSAIILVFGLSKLVQRFGVTAGLLLNPLIMVLAFLAIALSPSLFMIQALQVVRRVAQYAIARPSREICFTVVEQSSRYKTKNVIDTVVYRFGDVSSAWMQTGLRAAGFGFHSAIALGVGASVAWGLIASSLGRRYEQMRAALAE